MDRKKRNILIIVYVLGLFVFGFILIFITSQSKLKNQVDIFNNLDNDTETRWNALSKIAHYDEELVTDTILKALNDGDPYIRMEAAKWAEKRREYKAIPLLIRNLRDNTPILHPKAGRNLELVKITSYKALMSITGKDFGVIEAEPAEVAETIRKWELWWYKNADVYGIEVDAVKPDYETTILSPRIDNSRRLALLFAAEKDGYPGLVDIVIQLLKQKDYSLLKRRAIILAGMYKMNQAVPALVQVVYDRTMLESNAGVRIPLVAHWANESLVQITDEAHGPIFRGITEEQQTGVAREWEMYMENRKQTPKTEKAE